MRRGFTLPIINYTKLDGLNLYAENSAALKRSGLADYSTFVGKVFSAIQTHSDAEKWLPVYWNLADEPLGAALKGAAVNAKAYKDAFSPLARPGLRRRPATLKIRTIATVIVRLVESLHLANLANHDAASIRELQAKGVDWGFYNVGNRWTFGVYMFKAVEEFGLVHRLDWHWNASAGDPFYALDCREDDYAWAVPTPAGTLMSSVEFEREMREGIDDYRYLRTLHRRAKEAKDRAGLALIEGRIGRV